MANNVTDRAARATAAAGAVALFPVEVSPGEAGVESRERMPKLGMDAFAEQCRSLDHRSLPYRFVKRLFDLVFSACVVVIGFLPGLILSLAIVADTKGSPIYSQARIGRLGRTFRIYKFRTMVADSDDVEKYLDAEQLAEWHRERKVDDDPRVDSRIIETTARRSQFALAFASVFPPKNTDVSASFPQVSTLICAPAEIAGNISAYLASKTALLGKKVANFDFALFRPTTDSCPAFVGGGGSSLPHYSLAG